MYASPRIVPPVRSIQIGGQPFLEFIKYVMLCRRINTLVPQRLLRLANIALGELRAHKVAEVSYVALRCCSDNQNFESLDQYVHHPRHFFEALAAGQVGTPYADEGRACVRIPPLRLGQAHWGCCAAYDVLGLRHLIIV